MGIANSETNIEIKPGKERIVELNNNFSEISELDSPKSVLLSECPIIEYPANSLTKSADISPVNAPSN